MVKDKLNVGIIGCGNISQAYFNGLKMFPHAVEVSACADLSPQAADSKARENGVRALSVEALLADSGIDMVINLTIPKAHAEIALRALAAGKHVHSEKPFAVTREGGKKFWPSPRNENCASAAPPTRSWAPGSRPPAS